MSFRDVAGGQTSSNSGGTAMETDAAQDENAQAEEEALFSEEDMDELNNAIDCLALAGFSNLNTRFLVLIEDCSRSLCCYYLVCAAFAACSRHHQGPGAADGFI